MAKGSKLARLLNYFRDGDADEVRVVFTLVKEIMESRLQQKIAKTPIKRRKRRTAAEIAADNAAKAAKVATIPQGGHSDSAQRETAKASD